jgi:1-acyl-sn-glycerol-3-phosphate acyltransferase
MTRSVFTTPLLTPCLRLIANAWLKLAGWRVNAPEVPAPPFLFIGAPHTSNWDFMLLLAGVLHLRLDVRWMGKHTLFPRGLGWFMRWLGGIPVNRTRAHNMVPRMATLLREHPETILCVPPEGTRSKVREWKTGFYHIADQAGVPILMAAVDAEHRQLLMLGQFHPSGDVDEDMVKIREHYRPFKGIRPENASDPD